MAHWKGLGPQLVHLRSVDALIFEKLALGMGVSSRGKSVGAAAAVRAKHAPNRKDDGAMISNQAKDKEILDKEIDRK